MLCKKWFINCFTMEINHYEPASISVSDAGCDSHMVFISHSTPSSLVWCSRGYVTMCLGKRSSFICLIKLELHLCMQDSTIRCFPPSPWGRHIDITYPTKYFLLYLSIRPVIRYLCLQNKWIRDDLAIRRFEFQMYMCVFVFLFKIVLCWNILVCVQEPWGIISDGLGVIHDSI